MPLNPRPARGDIVRARLGPFDSRVRQLVAWAPRVLAFVAALLWAPAARAAALPAEVTIANAALSVTLRTADGTLAVQDRRTGVRWTQKRVSDDMEVTEADADRGIHLSLRHRKSGQVVGVALRLEGRQPEFTLTLTGQGALTQALGFPHPFSTAAGTCLVVPLNEGLAYPVEDQAVSPMRLVGYNGLSMSFWGVTDGEKGHMAIIETPDDAALHIARLDDRLCIAPEWIAQKGLFGNPRRLRYVFFDRGGYTEICKRYRAFVRKKGLLKTLTQKRRENPDVDLLVGAADVWGWEANPMPIVLQMRERGIERILWSSVLFGQHELSPETLKAMRDMGILTCRYDNYQDVMDPDAFKVVEPQPTWTTGAWPQDLALDAQGHRDTTWSVQDNAGRWYSCVAICDRQAVPYARRRIPQQLQTHPYRARFVDTTTAAHWRECYDPSHPMTRTDSRRCRMDLLRCVSEEMKLITGSENGHEDAVPYVHYLEGMLSLQPYRLPDADRDVFRLWEGSVPEPVAKFQLGTQYRLPLWELVFHDCVVSHWYWGDANNKIPALWEQRDLFNILYGTPPLFQVNRQIWDAYQERFARSYRRVCPIARAVGYAEMTRHRFLTPDRSVQQTAFSNGVTVTVNFGTKPFRLPNGKGDRAARLRRGGDVKYGSNEVPHES